VWHEEGAKRKEGGMVVERRPKKTSKNKVGRKRIGPGPGRPSRGG
jgi:hypothetical protein